MKQNSLSILTVVVVILGACTSHEKDYDATGTFEATEVVVSSEQSGRLLHLTATEGERVKNGQQLGLVDTLQLHLKALQMGATKSSFAHQRPHVDTQVAAVRQQLADAEREWRRMKALSAAGAATSQQYDDANSRVKVLQRQLNALLSSMGNSTESLNSQMNATDIQRRQVLDALEKCRIKSPLDGMVIEKYAEEGEFAAVGKPLFKVADTDKMFLRAYLTSAQLYHVKIGQKVKVFADYGEGKRKSYAGRVVWISSQSEFTPKTILTDDERADLVYAVKIEVKNDGYIKIGMYGEVKL